jgi:hypothetical protein
LSYYLLESNFFKNVSPYSISKTFISASSYEISGSSVSEGFSFSFSIWPYFYGFSGILDILSGLDF